jgi:hypothetical protein
VAGYIASAIPQPDQLSMRGKVQSWPKSLRPGDRLGPPHIDARRDPWLLAKSACAPARRLKDDIIFRATVRLRRSSRAAYTTPMPPWPNLHSIA